MNARQTALPIPDGSEWMTTAYAANRLDVDVTTVRRWITSGILNRHQPLSIRGEKAPTLLSAIEVEDLRNARIRTGQQQVKAAA